MSVTAKEGTTPTGATGPGVVKLYQTSIGKKIAMALAGVFLTVWLVLHMWGNLHFFEGPVAFNHYTEFLRSVGSPMFADQQLLWLARVLLLVAFLVHIGAFVQLWRRSAAARERGYGQFKPDVFSYASRTMIWGGIAILLFVVYHLLHLTWGTVHADFIPGDAYHNVLIGFQSPVVTGVYLLALVALALHLYHGVWSAFQTLGVNNPKYNRFRRPVALLAAVVLGGGFAAVPLAILLGIAS